MTATTWVQVLEGRTTLYIGICSIHGGVTGLCKSASAAQAQATVHTRTWCR